MGKTETMQKKVYQIVGEEYDSFAGLPESDRQMVAAAREASEKAYAPYSNFKVGAAVLLANGEIIRGNNQENADFTDGICAERVALFYANATYPDVAIKAMAITAINNGKLFVGPTQPCGSCRQVLVETESRYKQPIRLILDGAEKIMVFDGAENLLPFAFKPDSLG